MSQIRETNQDPFKSCKGFVLEKPCDFRALLIRGAVLIFILTSLTFIFSTASTAQRFRSLQCHGDGGSTGDAASAPDSGDITETLRDEPGPTNISHIVFGLAGSIKTWPARRHYSKFWWQRNRTRGFVWLDEEPKPGTSWPGNSPPYRVSENWTRFKYPSSQSSLRIARIVLECFRLGLPDVRWFVMGDDDTVFFTDNLVSVLAKYDHREMYYIGGSSESVEQSVMHAYDMAFGGGGFAISYPLAAALAEVLDGCIDRYYYFYGSDQRIWACASELGVPLTRELGFHQMDIRDDAYGLLAAHPVAPLVSLHHLDAVNPLFQTQTRLESLSSLITAYHTDPSRILQQTFSYDTTRNFTISISWGYTAQIYPSMVAANDLERPLQTFRTWRSWSDGPFAFNTRPLDPDPCQQPVIYFLDRVLDMGKGKTLTSYKRSAPRKGKSCKRADYATALAVNKIAVSSTKMDPRDWKKAPRRQCCEIQHGSLKNRVLRVNIRKCKPQEKVTR